MRESQNRTPTLNYARSNQGKNKILHTKFDITDQIENKTKIQTVKVTSALPCLNNRFKLYVEKEREGIRSQQQMQKAKEGQEANFPSSASSLPTTTQKPKERLFQFC